MRRTLGRSPARPDCAEAKGLPLAAGANVTLVVSDADDTDAALPLRLVTSATLELASPNPGPAPDGAPAAAAAAAAPGAAGASGSVAAPPQFAPAAVALKGAQSGGP